MKRHTLILLAAIALSGCSTDDVAFWEDDKPATKVPPPPDSRTPAFQPAAHSQTVPAASGKTIVMNEIGAAGIGTEIGTLTLNDTDAGLAITANLADLTPGDHGFHIHQRPSCAPTTKDGKMTAGEKAGPHFDPAKTDKHKGPTGGGHKGDLPVLTVAADGTTTGTVVAPQLKLADVTGHAIIIHEGGDNFSDKPKPNGGGGNRIACGIVQ